jgi:hypothetical protein
MIKGQGVLGRIFKASWYLEDAGGMFLSKRRGISNPATQYNKLEVLNYLHKRWER